MYTGDSLSNMLAYCYESLDAYPEIGIDYLCDFYQRNHLIERFYWSEYEDNTITQDYLISLIANHAKYRGTKYG
jgi:hypothetical protein